MCLLFLRNKNSLSTNLFSEAQRAFMCSEHVSITLITLLVDEAYKEMQLCTQHAEIGLEFKKNLACCQL